MSKNRLIVKGNNLYVLLREVIGSSLTTLSGNLVGLYIVVIQRQQARIYMRDTKYLSFKSLLSNYGS